MNSNTKQMKTIHLFFTMVLLGITTMTIQAQTNDWVGEWNTRFTHTDALWKLDITKNSYGEYIGTFPDGKLVGKITNGELTGTYTRTPNSFDRTGMGKMGEFRFVPAANNKNKFTGYYKVEGKDIWQADTWNGEKKLPPSLVEQIEKRETEKKLGTINKDFLPDTHNIWTGTWQTDAVGKLKIVASDRLHINGKANKPIAGSNRSTLFDLEGAITGGSNPNSSVKYYQGTIKTKDGKQGTFSAYMMEEGTFSGHITWSNPGYRGLAAATQEDFSGTKTSSSTPSLVTYY